MARPFPQHPFATSVTARAELFFAAERTGNGQLVDELGPTARTTFDLYRKARILRSLGFLKRADERAREAVDATPAVIRGDA